MDIEKNSDIASPRNITSIPTFHFIVGGQLKDEMKGASKATLEEKVTQWKVNVNPFAGKAFKLSSPDPSIAPVVINLIYNPILILFLSLIDLIKYIECKRSKTQSLWSKRI